MPLSAAIFDAVVPFDPGMDFDAFLKQVPAKWAVYLFADELDQPVQLLCVKSLRDSLKRRLGGQETIGLSRRVNYRDLVRKVYYRRVDSALEADWVYLEAAREVFPGTYQGMVGFRPAWFVHVNPEAPFPRYVKTTELVGKKGKLIGPVEDKHAAARLMEMAEDTYDLCRYYNVLVEAPRGKACAYKEMGKCAAPCDGTISMEEYRSSVAQSAAAVVDPEMARVELMGRMKKAAAELKFEVAGRLKQKVEQVDQLGKGPFRHARELEDFRFVSVQRGPRQGTAKVFLIVKGEIEEAVGLIAEPVKAGEVLRFLLERIQELARSELNEKGVERIGLVSHHLFSPKKAQGVNVQIDDLDEKALAKAFREIRKQKGEEEVPGEGVMKELQAM